MGQSKFFAKIVFFTVLLFSAILIDSFSSFSANCDSIRENTLRLHILANSDSPKDQEIKLKVRDRILKESGNLFYFDDGILNAKEKAKNNLTAIENIAKDELAKLGVESDVSAELTNMFFDTRVYDSFTMPAGRYDALRIKIGKADGKNWWCVLYPRLCLPTASKNNEGILNSVFTQDEVSILESKPKYEIRFYAVEVFQKIKNKLS